MPYASVATGSKEGYAAEPGDFPYEPPKQYFAGFDAGPGPSFARLLMGGEPGLAWPDFASLGVVAHLSFGYGPIYRGRPAEARVLVLADQESHDDLFLFRAMTGDAGQRFQEFLRAMGMTRSYLILRVLPVDTLGLAANTVEALVDHAQVRQVYRTIVERVAEASGTSLVLSVGPLARRQRAHVLPAGMVNVDMKAWHESSALDDWKRALNDLRSVTYTKDLPSPTFAYDGQRGQIPRIDLPYGTLRWQGISGDRAVRAVPEQPSPHYYKLLMPRWAFDLSAEPLSPEEAKLSNRRRSPLMPIPPIDPETARYALEGRVVTMNAGLRRRAIRTHLYRSGADRLRSLPPDARRLTALRGRRRPYRRHHLSWPHRTAQSSELQRASLVAVDGRFENRGVGEGGRLSSARVAASRRSRHRTDGLVQSVVRYVEAKCLVAGVTTSQGISLSSNDGHQAVLSRRRAQRRADRRTRPARSVHAHRRRRCRRRGVSSSRSSNEKDRAAAASERGRRRHGAPSFPAP